MVMINTRLLQLAAIGPFLALTPTGAFAGTITSADLTISNLTISSADVNFFLIDTSAQVTAQAGPDSFGNHNSQTFDTTGTTAADATIPTATAHADKTGSQFSVFGPGLSITDPATVNVSSSVNLIGASSSHSFGIANPTYEFQAPAASATNPIHLTFSMTVAGLLSGSADSNGTYSSEVNAQFGYFSGGSPNSFVPVVFFDLPLSGGPSDSQNIDISSQTLTGTVTLTSSADYIFNFSAEAQSSGTELGTSTTPLPAALPLFASGLGALGLLGWRRKRKAQAAA
jgi:hypothetical protein